MDAKTLASLPWTSIKSIRQARKLLGESLSVRKNRNQASYKCLLKIENVFLSAGVEGSEGIAVLELKKQIASFLKSKKLIVE